MVEENGMWWSWAFLAKHSMELEVGFQSLIPLEQASCKNGFNVKETYIISRHMWRPRHTAEGQHHPIDRHSNPHIQPSLDLYTFLKDLGILCGSRPSQGQRNSDIANRTLYVHTW
jgi:hypothetical protein